METKSRRSTSFQAVLWLAVLALLSTAGCGGGGGGGGGGDPSLLCAKAQAHITPLDGSSNVPWNTTVTLTVDKDTIDCTSVTSSTFTLATDAGVGVAGKLACDGTTVTFTPDAPLAPSTKYVAYVTTMKNAAGSDICDHSRWIFTTAPDFTVATTVPAANATAVRANTKVTATFSSPVDCTTVNASTFTLAGGAAVAGVVSCSGATATFAPNALLSPGTQYTATLAATVKGTNGATLGSDQTWSFTTSPANQVWIKDPLQPISNKWVEAVGADGSGNVLLLYKQRVQSSGVNILTATRYKHTPATPWLEGWYNPWDLWSHAGSSAAKIAVSKNGNALVLGKTDGNALNYTYYHADTNSWSGQTAVSLGGAVTDFHPAIDDNGNAMLLWSETGAGTDQVYGRYYNATSGTLGAAQAVGDNGWPHRLKPRFAFGPNGNGTAVFWEWQGVWDGSTAYGIASRDYDATTDTWSAAVTQISTTDTPNDPAIAIDSSGNAVVIWTRQQLWNDPPSHYYSMVDGANRAAGSTTWVSAYLGVGWDPKGDASDPRLVMLPNGDAMATWTYMRQGTTDAEVNAAYMVKDNLNSGYQQWNEAGQNMTPIPADQYEGWRVVFADANGGVASPSLVVDSSGKAVLVYSKSDGTRTNVYQRSFSWAVRSGDVSGWSAAVEIDSTEENANGPIIAADGTGATMTLWNQWNANYSTPMNDFWYLRQ